MLPTFACVVGLLVGVQAAAPQALSQRQTDDGDTTLDGNCSIDSFTNVTSFFLREYEINTVVDAANVTRTLGTISVENPGSGDIYTLDRFPISTGGGVWSTCTPGEVPLPSQLQRCQYLLERREGGRIGFRFDWYCDGEEPGQRVIFDATAVGEMPAEICEDGDGTDGVMRSCGLGVEDLELPIANIYWEDAPKVVD